MTFHEIDLAHKDIFTTFWQKMPIHSIDYTLVNLWGWRNYYGLKWHFTDTLCWINAQPPLQSSHTYWAPIGDWHAVHWQEEPLLQNMGPQGIQLARVPETLVHILEEALPGRITKEECRGQWEYLYASKDLATLPGNKYHRKRNHINSFKKTYGEPDYRAIDSNCIDDVFALQDEWCRWHECANSDALKAENESINQVLSHWNDFPHLIGGTIYIDQTLVAFSVGELLDDNTLGVHYEKGHTNYRGVYQCMNSLFVQNAGNTVDFINRAQDLDEEGLRKAKSSYLPTDFLRKFTVHIAPNT